MYDRARRDGVYNFYYTQTIPWQWLKSDDPILHSNEHQRLSHR